MGKMMMIMKMMKKKMKKKMKIKIGRHYLHPAIRGSDKFTHCIPLSLLLSTSVSSLSLSLSLSFPPPPFFFFFLSGRQVTVGAAHLARCGAKHGVHAVRHRASLKPAERRGN